MKRGLPLLKLFQCCKKFRVLLLLCPWFPRLISIAASFGLSSIIHGKSSFEITIVYSQRDDWTLPAILFEPIVLHEEATVLRYDHWPNHSLANNEPTKELHYQADPIWSAIMVSFFREISDWIIFFLPWKGLLRIT